MQKGIIRLLGLLAIYLGLSSFSLAQTIQFKITDKASKEPLQGAIIQNKDASIGSESDVNGIAQITISNTLKQLNLQVHIMGYNSFEFTLSPDTCLHLQQLLLEKTKNELGTVVINTLRTNTRIEDAPK